MRILPLPDVEAAVLPVRPALEAAVRRHVLRQRDEVPVPHFAEVAARRLDLRAVLVVDDVGERRLDASERAPADRMQEVDVLRLRVDGNPLHFERERLFVRGRVHELRRLHDEAVAVAVLVVADEVHRNAVAVRDSPRRPLERELRALVNPAVASVLCHLVDEAAVHELPQVDRMALVRIDDKRRLFDDALGYLRLETRLPGLERLRRRKRRNPLDALPLRIALLERGLIAVDVELNIAGNKIHHVLALPVRQYLLAVRHHFGLAVHHVDLVPDMQQGTRRFLRGSAERGLEADKLSAARGGIDGPGGHAAMLGDMDLDSHGVLAGLLGDDRANGHDARLGACLEKVGRIFVVREVFAADRSLANRDLFAALHVRRERLVVPAAVLVAGKAGVGENK